MLTITIPGNEFFDEETSEFVTLGDVTLELEHSLVSLSKWESKFEKPFLGKGQKTDEETLAYVKMMILTKDYPEDALSRLTEENAQAIQKYIHSQQTATTFPHKPGGTPSRETITSELIYFWMINYNIPIECEKWHVNRLITLIQVCNVKNSKPKKMSKSELAARNRELNARRRNDLGSRG